MNKIWTMALFSIAAAGCRQLRETTAPAPIYQDDIAIILQARCDRCHANEDAGASFRTDSYQQVTSCPSDKPGASAFDGESAAILQVLDRADHEHHLNADEAARLRAWVQAGAPRRRGAVHDPGISNPRSPHWHGQLAARDQFGPITKTDHPQACGRCHAGAPVTPTGITYPAPDAPACTSCHQQPQGVLACGTCHGDGAERAAPPRDPCLFPRAPTDAHSAHLESTRIMPEPLACSSCHGAVPTTLGGNHGDGKVDVVFEAALAGEDARYDPATGKCSVGCHNRGGKLAQPSFAHVGPLACGDCHNTPPDDHYAGACDRCHGGVDARGETLLNTLTHLDGTSGPGTGPAACGACHGRGEDPAPLDSAPHSLHLETPLMQAIRCSECHPVPEQVSSERHLDKGEVTPADIQLGELASARGRQPSFSEGRCNDIACHGAGLGDRSDQSWSWQARATQQDCARCHGAPPSPPHVQDMRCASLVCHGTEVSANGQAITASGRSLHINGHPDTLSSF